MLASKKTRRGVIGAVVLASVLAVSGYALTNTATVPASYAGDGTGAVQTVTASAIHYNLDTTDPEYITSVTFSVAEAVATSGTAHIQLEDAAGPPHVAVTNGDWAKYACVNGTPGAAVSTWTCTAVAAVPGTEAKVLDSLNLQVVIAD